MARWAKKGQSTEGPPPDASFNVELRYLDDDVRMALQLARKTFKSFMTKKPLADGVAANRNDIIATYNDVRVTLIGTARYGEKEIKNIRTDIITMTNTSTPSDFLNKAQILLDDLHLAVANKSLFKRLMKDERSIEDRV